MTTLLEQFGLNSLSTTERITLAQALWDSVHEAIDDELVPPEVVAELRKRSELSDVDPSRGVSWQTVRDEARARWTK